jgi:CHASE2 domain-containing sensor protein
MRTIFISYRHDDSFASAKLLFEHLGRWLTDTEFFIDESGIEAGAEWRGRLGAKLAEADAVLVVIGPRWSRIADPSGARRLENPDDVVRWEVGQALAAHKRVIPVLVEGAQLPEDAELPLPLKALARLQYRAIGRQTFEGDIHALARELSEGGAAGDPARWIWLIKRSLVLVPAVSAVMILVAASHVFDQVDIWLQNRMTWLGDGLVDVPLRDELRIVALQPGDGARSTGGEAERLHPSRRVQFAALLDELTRQRARRVVFDVTMAGDSEYDDRLAASIVAARRAGVGVVIGFKEFDPRTGNPRVATKIERAGPDVGVVCVGDRGGGGNNVAFATLAMMRNGQVHTSLPLLAVYGPIPPGGLTAASSEVQLPGMRKPVPISLTEVFDEHAPLCPARTPGTAMARFIPHLSNRAALRRPSVRHSFDEVMRSGGGDGANFHDKTVLVGVEQPRDLLETPLDLVEPRYGFEFQADAINALLAERIVVPMTRLGQAVSVMVMAALAAVIRLSRLGMAGRGSAWLPWIALVIYAGLAVLAYRVLDRLWQPTFSAAAFVVTWTALGFLCRRWSNGKR